MTQPLMETVSALEASLRQERTLRLAAQREAEGADTVQRAIAAALQDRDAATSAEVEALRARIEAVTAQRLKDVAQIQNVANRFRALRRRENLSAVAPIPSQQLVQALEAAQHALDDAGVRVHLTAGGDRGPR